MSGPGLRKRCAHGGACGARVHEALAHAFARRDLAYEVPFFFPTVGEYAPLVEAAGMRVTYATLFDRPTAQVGPDGMVNWIRMFVRRPFDGMDSAEAGGIVSEAVAELRPTMLRDGTWFVDYTRLRMRAVRI